MSPDFASPLSSAFGFCMSSFPRIPLGVRASGRTGRRWTKRVRNSPQSSSLELARHRALGTQTLRETTSRTLQVCQDDWQRGCAVQA